ncbi:MAG: PP0621 family protein [Gammaproteobacteria bacterium]
MWLLKRLFSDPPEPERLSSTKGENMRQCKYCGVHVPESSILTVNDQPYCCQEHADLDQH